MINLSYCVYLLVMARLEQERVLARIRRTRWVAKDPEREKKRLRKKAIAYQKAHPDKKKQQDRKYYQKTKGNRLQKYAACPVYRLVQLARNRVNRALKRGCKSAKTFELLGCSAEQLKQHLEKQFRPGMTWENYGPVWHVDHIKPCAVFDLTDAAQQRLCFHYTNLQPLGAIDNLIKGDKYGNPSG